MLLGCLLRARSPDTARRKAIHSIIVGNSEVLTLAIPKLRSSDGAKSQPIKINIQYTPRTCSIVFKETTRKIQNSTSTFKRINSHQARPVFSCAVYLSTLNIQRSGRADAHARTAVYSRIIHMIIITSLGLKFSDRAEHQQLSSLMEHLRSGGQLIA